MSFPQWMLDLPGLTDEDREIFVREQVEEDQFWTDFTDEEFVEMGIAPGVLLRAKHAPVQQQVQKQENPQQQQQQQQQQQKQHNDPKHADPSPEYSDPPPYTTTSPQLPDPAAAVGLGAHGAFLFSTNALINDLSNPRQNQHDSVMTKKFSNFFSHDWSPEALQPLGVTKLDPDMVVEYGGGFPRSFMVCAVQSGRPAVVKSLLDPPIKMSPFLSLAAQHRGLKTSPLNEALQLHLKKSPKVQPDTQVEMVKLLVDALIARKRKPSDPDAAGVSPETLLEAIEKHNQDLHDRLAALVFQVPTGVTGISGGTNQDRALALVQLPPTEFTQQVEAEFVGLLTKFPDLVEAEIPFEDESLGVTTLLYSSCRARNLRAVNLLLGAGACPNQEAAGGNTPMHIACFRGFPDIVATLLGHNARDLAAQRKSVEQLNQLGESCTTHFSPNVDGETVQRILALTNVQFAAAAEDLFPKIEKEEAGAAADLVRLVGQNPNSPFVDSNSKKLTTLLLRAIRLNNQKVVELLLSAAIGADANFVGAQRMNFARNQVPGKTGAAAKQGRTPAAAALGGGLKIATPCNLPLLECWETHKNAQIGRELVAAGAELQALIDKPESQKDKDLIRFLRSLRVKDNLVLFAFEAAKNEPDSDINDLKKFIHQRLDANMKPNPIDPNFSMLGSAIVAKNGTALDLLLRPAQHAGGPAGSLIANPSAIASTSTKQNALMLTLVHISDPTWMEKVCEIMLPFVDDLDYEDSQGQTALALAVKVAHITPLPQKLIEAEIEKRKKMKQKRAFSDYCDSLPQRKLGTSTVVMPPPTNLTEQAVVDAVSTAVSKGVWFLVRDKLWAASTGPSEMNPFLGAVLESVATETVKEALTRLGATPIEKLAGVAPPAFLPFDVEQLAMDQLATSYRAMVGAMADNFVKSPVRSTLEVLANRLITRLTPAVLKVDEPKHVMDGCAEAHKAFCDAARNEVKKELSAGRQGAPCLFLGNFVREVVEDQIVEFGESPELNSVLGIGKAYLAVTNAPPTPAPTAAAATGAATATATQPATPANQMGVVSRLVVSDKELNKFLQPWIKSWMPNASLKNLCTALHLLGKKPLWWFAKCELIDKEIEKGFTELAEEEAHGMMKTFATGPDFHESETWVVSKDYTDIVAQEMMTPIKRYCGSAANELHKVTVIDSALLPSLNTALETAASAMCLSLLSMKIMDKVKANFTNKTATQRAVTQESFDRFKAEVAKLMSSVKGNPPTGQTFFDNFVRPLSHNFFWHFLSAYSVLDDVKTAYDQHDIVLLTAATGSGKSVMIPQFIHEVCNAVNVTCTQPRRAPVLNMFEHVGMMLGNAKVGCAVGGQPHENREAPVQYVTDALMMGRLLATDEFTLGGAKGSSGAPSALVIDEAHERSSVMDLVFLTACKKLSNGLKNNGKKIVLASATLSKQSTDWYMDTAKKFGLKIKPVELPGGKLMYNVTNTVHPTVMKPDDKTRAQQAAQDAWDIMKADNNNKVLVFLPNRQEIMDAAQKFKVISANKIPCEVLHAQVTDLLGSVARGSVLFSNQIAEASITVKGLTHVLDFNLNMRAEIDDTINCHTLAIAMATNASQIQRRGRVGRMSDGHYKTYGDLTSLQDGYPMSFELLSNDDLIQYEIRVRHFLKSTLFKNNLDGFTTLGLGISPRPTFSAVAKAHIPKNAKDLHLVASLGLSGGMSTAFLYALKQNTCPRAILQISCFSQSRVPMFEAGGEWKQKHFDKFAKIGGDYAATLDVFHQYREEKKKAERAPSHMGAAKHKKNVVNACKKWAKGLDFRHSYLENIDERMTSLEEMLTKDHKLTMTDTYSAWTWDDISDALMAGYWQNSAALVKNNFTVTRGYFHGTFHSLEGHQTTALKAHRGSLYENNVTGGPPPDYICYPGGLKRYDAKGQCFVNGVVVVDPKLITKWELPSATKTVTQSLYIMGQTLDKWSLYKLQTGYSNASAAALAGAYPNTTIETNKNAFSQRVAAATATIQGKVVEFKVTGPRVTVHERLEEIVSDINAGLTQVNNYSNNKNLSDFCKAFGCPPASLAQLHNADPAMAARCEKACKKRTKTDLKNAISSGNAEEKHLAIFNILVNDFGVIPKGGPVRDIIVLGLGKMNDLDCELRPDFNKSQFSRHPLQTGPSNQPDANLKTDVQKWSSLVSADYGIQTTNVNLYAPGGSACDMARFYWAGVEIECVCPWNSRHLPCVVMDFSCNNLMLEPGFVGIKQLVPIAMTVLDIIRQLKASPMETSPCRESKWVRGAGSDGQSGKSQLQANDPGLPQGRIDKFRTKKRFKFVEYAMIPGHPLTLFHGTKAQHAATIVNGGFDLKFASNGLCGVGTYMSRDMRIVKSFAGSGAIIQAHYMPTVTIVETTNIKWPHDSWHASTITPLVPPYAFMLPSDFSPRGPPQEEICIRDVKNIVDRERIQ